MPFIRMMAGNVDYTQGSYAECSEKDFRDIYSSPMSQGTRCHQLATYIVFDSPLVMLCGCTDRLSQKEPVNVPALSPVYPLWPMKPGYAGENGRIYRHSPAGGEDWIVGGLTDWEARTVDLDLSFLPEGMFRAEIFCDGINADKREKITGMNIVM